MMKRREFLTSDQRGGLGTLAAPGILRRKARR